jgi:hypothetical protein
MVKQIEVLPYSINYLSINGTNYTQVYDFCEEVNNKSFVASGLYCTIIPKYEYEAFEFIKNNIKEKNIILFSDMGYRTKFYTEKEEVYAEIGEIFYLFVNENEQKLWDYMNETNTNYFILSRDMFVKWNSITYLSCYHEGKIKIDEEFEDNECMNENKFEIIHAPHIEINRCKEGNIYGIHFCIIYDSFLLNERIEEGEDIQVVEKTYLINGTHHLLKIRNDKKIELKAYNSVFYKGIMKEEEMEGFEKIYKNNEKSSISIYKRVSIKE